MSGEPGDGSARTWRRPKLWRLPMYPFVAVGENAREYPAQMRIGIGIGCECIELTPEEPLEYTDGVCGKSLHSGGSWKEEYALAAETIQIKVTGVGCQRVLTPVEQAVRTGALAASKARV